MNLNGPDGGDYRSSIDLRKQFFWTAVIFATLLFLLAPVAHCQTCVSNSQVTLVGNLRGANGIASSNYVMTMAPSQQGYIAGCGVNLPTNFACATSTDGSVVGIPNPLTATINTTSGSGSLPSGVYYTVYEFYDALNNVTLASPETRTTLSVTESLVVNPPTSGIPSNAVGMDVFIGTSSGGETLQGQTTGTASFVQSTPLTSGVSPSTANSTVCKVTANDAVWPVGTGYNVNLVDSQGNPVPQYPMQWQLLGPGTTYNLSNGLPYYHGVVLYPVPILAQPPNHGTQSISGSLNLGGYNLLNAGQVGIGTATPGWPLDVENGLANFQDGLIVGGNAPTMGYCLASSSGVSIDEYVACLSSLPTFYYQTVALSDAAQTQRPTLNFVAPLTVTDSSSPAETTIGLTTVGTGGSVLEAASLGTPGNCMEWGAAGATDAGNPCLVSGAIDDYFTTVGCSVVNSGNLNSCKGTVTFIASGGNTTPSFAAMPDTNYRIFCTVDTGTFSSASFSVWGNSTSATPVFTRTTTAFDYVWTEVMSNTATGSNAPVFDCHLHHS